MPAGAKRKYEEWLTADGLLRIEGWARDGLTNAQIAHNMGINASTLYDWSNKLTEISNAIKKGKAPVDIEVENALYKRALGYDYEEVITEIYDAGGDKERKHVRRIKKHMPPDTTAIIYWLNNRKPQYWRNRRVVVDEQPSDDPLNKLIGELDAQCDVQR